MNEPLDQPDEIDDSPRDEEIAALKEDVKALRGLLRRATPFLECHTFTGDLIAEIEKELEG